MWGDVRARWEEGGAYHPFYLSCSRLRNAITREKLRFFVRFATYKQESSDKYPFLVKVRPMCSVQPPPLLSMLS